MTSNIKIKILSTLILSAIISSFVTVPNVNQNNSRGINAQAEDYSVDQCFPGQVEVNKGLTIQENPRPKWDDIINSTFRSLGVTQNIEWQERQDWYYSAYARDYELDEHNLSLSISTKSSFEVWYCDTCPSSNYDPRVEEIDFHSQKAKFISVYREPYGLESYEIEWEMDGLYYSVVFTAIVFKGTSDPLFPAADAMYYAAGGTGSSSSIPTEPENPPSAPQPESPSEPQNNPAPGDLCAAVACNPDHCADDGKTLFYDCACDNFDGECYCWTEECEFGCDAAASACKTKLSGGLCGNVVCNPDYCSEDGKTRFYDCECDPADGECYCWTETCSQGCDTVSNTCIGQDQPVDLCEGVTCVVSSCADDGITLNYDCACDPGTGACDCRTESCANGCDPDTLACKPDLCAGVDCLDKCEENISCLNGACDPANGECVYAQQDDCGLAGCDPSANVCKSLADLAIKDLTILQAVEGGILVEKKPTAVVLGLDWPDPNENAVAGVTLFIDGVPFQTIKHITKHKYLQNETYRSKDKIIFHILSGYLSSGNHEFQFEAVLLDDQKVDGDLSNNSYSITKNFTVSRSVTLLYAAQFGIPKSQIYTFHNRARSFLLNVFPVTDVRMASTFYTLDIGEPVKNQVAQLEELRNIYNMDAGKYARFAVGLFPDGEHGEGVNGFSFVWARRSVMVGDGSSNIYAHQALPHEMGHELFGDEYYNYYITSSIGKSLPKDIYIYDGQRKWLTNLAYERGGMVNIMGNAGTAANLWVNKETWNDLVGLYGIQTGLAPQNAKLASLPSLEQQETAGFLISGTITADDQVTISTLLPFENMPVENMYEGDYWIEVYNKSGALDGRYPLEIEFADSESEGFFLSKVPADIKDTQELHILHNEDIIWKSEASDELPQVDINMPSGGGAFSGAVEVTWQAQDADSQDLTFTLLYSYDDGETWLPLANGLQESRYTLELDDLPGGAACRLRVIASDGWNAVQADTPDAFTVEDKPLNLVLDSPQDGAHYNYKQAIDLSAVAYDIESGWVGGEGINWKSSIDGDLGTGANLRFNDLSVGEHILTAFLITSAGDSLQESVTFTITAPPSSSMNDKVLYGILSGVALLLVGGAVFMLIKMKRRGRKPLLIFAIVLLIVFVVFLGISLISFLDSLVVIEPTYRRVSTPEVDQIMQPMLNISDEAGAEGDSSNSTGIIVEHNGVSFTSPFGDSSAETLPADISEDPFGGLPEHDQFIINSYPSENEIFEPVIRVFPLETYRAVSDEASEQITLLQELLSNPSEIMPAELPLLPVMNAGALGTAQFAIMNFNSGAGLRYITQYAQNFWPANNNGLFYTFQGITADNAYYISALLPLAHNSLDEYDQFQPSDDFYETAAQLIEDQFTALDNADMTSFTPSISVLDEIISSITVEK